MAIDIISIFYQSDSFRWTYVKHSFIQAQQTYIKVSLKVCLETQMKWFQSYNYFFSLNIYFPHQWLLFVDDICPSNYNLTKSRNVDGNEIFMVHALPKSSHPTALMMQCKMILQIINTLDKHIQWMN